MEWFLAGLIGYGWWHHTTNRPYYYNPRRYYSHLEVRTPEKIKETLNHTALVHH